MLARPEWILESKQAALSEVGVFWRVCRPSYQEFHRQLEDLRKFCGGDEFRTSELLGITAMTFQSWWYCQAKPSDAARRAVWLTWVLVLHPERIRSLFDILTWGRFSTAPKPQRKASFATVAHEDYSI